MHNFGHSSGQNYAQVIHDMSGQLSVTGRAGSVVKVNALARVINDPLQELARFLWDIILNEDTVFDAAGVVDPGLTMLPARLQVSLV